MTPGKVSSAWRMRALGVIILIVQWGRRDAFLIIFQLRKSQRVEFRSQHPFGTG
jgi:hypothetical protein